MLLAIFDNFCKKDEENSTWKGKGEHFHVFLLFQVAVTLSWVDWLVHIFVTCISTRGLAMIPLLHAPHSLECLHTIFNNFHEEEISILEGQHFQAFLRF